jgi:hypothetical protein
MMCKYLLKRDRGLNMSYNLIMRHERYTNGIFKEAGS